MGGLVGRSNVSTYVHPYVRRRSLHPHQPAYYLRHGDLLNRYLYLTGRVDMRSIEVTIQHLITNGFNPKIKKDPYKGFIYTSFQERATKISHQNVARLANTAGACRALPCRLRRWCPMWLTDARWRGRSCARPSIDPTPKSTLSP